MARPRNFDIEDAIEKASDVFWAHGYDGASLNDLLDGMGLTRGSLYKAFADKKSLFLRVLQHYEGHAVERGVALLTDESIPDGRNRIKTMFSAVYKAVSSGDRRGCLLCSAAAGPSAYDPEISAQVAEGLGRLQTGLVTALEASPKHADWDDAARLKLANHLLTQYVGLRILSRSTVPLGVLEHSAETVADILA